MHLASTLRQPIQPLTQLRAGAADKIKCELEQASKFQMDGVPPFPPHPHTTNPPPPTMARLFRLHRDHMSQSDPKLTEKSQSGAKVIPM